MRKSTGLRTDDRNSFDALGWSKIIEPRQINAQHFLIQKQQRKHRLVFRAGGDIFGNSQMSQKLINLIRAHFKRMSDVMKKDIPFNLINVSFFRRVAVMTSSHYVPN